MGRWPWISLLLGALAVVNPLGLEVIHAAFLSGESLSRGIWQPIVAVAVAIFLTLVVVEWWVRKRRAERRGA
jgi:hypothetical protein